LKETQGDGLNPTYSCIKWNGTLNGKSKCNEILRNYLMSKHTSDKEKLRPDMGIQSSGYTSISAYINTENPSKSQTQNLSELKEDLKHKVLSLKDKRKNQLKGMLV
jgi:hypothetical protein